MKPLLPVGTVGLVSHNWNLLLMFSYCIALYVQGAELAFLN